MNSAITIEGLNFTYSGATRQALKDVNIDVKKGQFVLLTGASGAGKSTLCLTLNRIIPEIIKGNFSGNIYIEGHDISSKNVSEIGRTVGIVFQDYESQIFSTRVDLEVAFGLENRGVNRGEIRRRVKEALEMTGLSGLEERAPVTLSGGQKQRLAIASMLAMEPNILVLDEPLTDLDPAGRREILEVLYRLKEKGKTIIFVEHDFERITPDLFGLLGNGELVIFDKPDLAFSQVVELKKNGVKPHPFIEISNKTGIKINSLRIDEVYSILKKHFRHKMSEQLCAEKYQRAETDYVVEFDNTSYVYPGDFVALKGINLKIKRGDFIALVGHNGCGKTTLAKHMVRLLLPTEGVVRVFGMDTRKLKRSEIGKKVGYVFQNPDHQIFSETVYEEVAFAPRNFKLTENQIKINVQKAIETVGLSGKEHLDPFMLSRGEREKVAVASVLSVIPEILILDEPTTGLDWTEKKQTMEMLRKLNEEGRTVLIITHSMDIVAEYANTVIAMNDGEIVFYGDVCEFFSRPEYFKNFSLEPPLITELGWKFGLTVLSVDEFTGYFYDRP